MVKEKIGNSLPLWHQSNNFIFAGDVPSLRMARRHVYARALARLHVMREQSTKLQYCIPAFAIGRKPKLTRLFGRAAKLRRPNTLPSKIGMTPIKASSLYGLPDPPPPRKMAWVELILWRMVTATSTEMAGPDIATTVKKTGHQTRFWSIFKKQFVK